MTASRITRFIAAFALAGTGAHAATFNVTRGDDPAPDSCLASDCSLREAIEATPATPGVDTIVLGAGQYQITRGELSIASEMIIEGAGSGDTRIVASGDVDLFHVMPFGALTLQGAEIGSPDDSAMVIEDNANALLRDVVVPANAGLVGTVLPPGDSGTGSIRIEHSTIASTLGCLQPQGSCRVFDSHLHEVLVLDSEVEFRRIDLDGANTDQWGLTIGGAAPVTIEDSTIRRTSTPLRLAANGTTTGARVTIKRTRFLDNTGPLYGDRSAIVDMDEVEFRHHRVSDDLIGAPAVLLAQQGPAWFISRALVANNRGGNALDGAVVRVLGGGRVVFDNSTFDDNTFRTGLAGFGHTIGLYNNTGLPAILWLFHTTMQRSIYLEDDTQGSLVTVRGTPADVRIDNSLLRGTCAFGGGGAITQGVGNVETIGDTCGLDPADNEVDVSALAIGLGDLADNGGFTQTMLPQRNSVLLDAADTDFCTFFGALDQRGYARAPDGTDCDVGAVEAYAVADSIFANGFDG